MEIVYKKSANKDLEAKAVSLTSPEEKNVILAKDTELVLIAQTGNIGTVINEANPELLYKISMADWTDNTTKVSSHIV